MDLLSNTDKTDSSYQDTRVTGIGAFLGGGTLRKEHQADAQKVCEDLLTAAEDRVLRQTCRSDQ